MTSLNIYHSLHTPLHQFEGVWRYCGVMALQTFLKCVKLLHSFITSKVFELSSSDCAQIEGIFNAVPDLI